jgi:hypothetical protein
MKKSTKSATHVTILGVKIPLATLAYSTSTVQPAIISEYADYMTFSEFLTKTLKDSSENTIFKDVAERRSIPCKVGKQMQFFQYDNLGTDAMYEGSI